MDTDTDVLWQYLPCSQCFLGYTPGREIAPLFFFAYKIGSVRRRTTLQ